MIEIEIKKLRKDRNLTEKTISQIIKEKDILTFHRTPAPPLLPTLLVPTEAIATSLDQKNEMNTK